MEPEDAADGQSTQRPSHGSTGKQRLHLLLPSLEMRMKKTKRKMKMNKTNRKMKMTKMKMKTMAQDASTARVHPHKG